MPDFLPDDDRFAELMKKSSLRMPFSDFDDNVMRRIEAGLKAKESILRNINIAILFFALGTGCGIASVFLLPSLLSYFKNDSPEGIHLAFQAIFVLITLTQLDKLIGLVKKYGNL